MTLFFKHLKLCTAWSITLEWRILQFFSLAFLTTACKSYEFTCDNGDCIYDSDACDGKEDCSDGSDEQGCGETLNIKQPNFYK